MKKTDLQSVVDNDCPHLKLLELLRKYEDLFGGTLGDWNTEPVCFKLKEGAKPYHGRAFPVPHSLKETLMKEPKTMGLPMGIAGSPDIVQSKMMELMATLKFVRASIDDLLCITKGTLEEIGPLQTARCKPKSKRLQIKLCAIETEYLGYTLSQDRIKPQPKKVQSILALTPPKNVKDLFRFLSMVQRYQDLWVQHSKMLAPLTSLVRKCGHTKQSKLLYVKKKPWKWTKEHQKAFDDIKATIA
eukprot:CCRYP_003710-RA/>CCRYP_003710-RA protein AED:0.70 eAED:0.51 QI:0/0/0/0.5/1/1/2/0/243